MGDLPLTQALSSQGTAATPLSQREERREASQDAKVAFDSHTAVQPLLSRDHEFTQSEGQQLDPERGLRYLGQAGPADRKGAAQQQVRATQSPSDSDLSRTEQEANVSTSDQAGRDGFPAQVSEAYTRFLSQKITEAQIFKLGELLSDLWENLAVELRMKRYNIRTFKANNKDNVEAQAREMLFAWRQKLGKEATNRKIMEALARAEKDTDTWDSYLDYCKQRGDTE